MHERPTRSRPESREVAELKQLREAQPDLASAVDLQLALVEVQRRVQGRVPLPWIQAEPAWVAEQQRAGRPIVRFTDIPLDWTDFRLTLRQTTDILHRFEVVEDAERDRLVVLARDNDLAARLGTWYDQTSGVDPASPRERPVDAELPTLDQVFVLALRPFLARSAESLVQRIDLAGWRWGYCPFCGWEPEFAVVLPSAERRLICGRCLAQWAFQALACPFCGNDDRQRITSFATRDGRYRVSACDVCLRYLKAYDARNAPRAVMMAVDTIATLPLDAAAAQKGYTG